MVKQCAQKTVELVCGLEQRKKTEAVPLSNDVIYSRGVNLSYNILNQVMGEHHFNSADKWMKLVTSLNAASYWFSFAMCMLIPSKKNFCFPNPFWKQQRPSTFMALCRDSLSNKIRLEEKSWYSVHRRSTCHARQHIWFCCCSEGKNNLSHLYPLFPSSACTSIKVSTNSYNGSLVY